MCLKFNRAIFKLGFAMITLFYSCNNTTKSTHEMILDPGYSEIMSIHTIADCKSPYGSYSTEIKSEQDGSVVFIQKQSGSESSFHVQINAEQQGFIIDELNNIKDTLAIEDIEMIRGHEFHKIHTNPSHFFSDIKYDKNLNDEFDLYIAKDRLGHSVSLEYNFKHQLIYKIHLLNPKDTTEQIEIINKKFVPYDQGKMVKELEVVQAKKDTFYFNFKRIKIN